MKTKVDNLEFATSIFGRVNCATEASDATIATDATDATIATDGISIQLPISKYQYCHNTAMP